MGLNAFEKVRTIATVSAEQKCFNDENDGDDGGGDGNNDDDDGYES